jgi:hypothetical protein
MAKKSPPITIDPNDRRRRKRHITSLLESEKRALRAYIERQFDLLVLAKAQDKLDLARMLSQDVARATGIPSKEIYGKAPADLMEALKTSFAKLNRPPEEDPPVGAGVAFISDGKLH